MSDQKMLMAESGQECCEMDFVSDEEISVGCRLGRNRKIEFLLTDEPKPSEAMRKRFRFWELPDEFPVQSHSVGERVRMLLDLVKTGSKVKYTRFIDGCDEFFHIESLDISRISEGCVCVSIELIQK